MKILFLTRHFGCLRSFERPIFTLAAAGHDVRLVAHQGDNLGGDEMVQRWSAIDQRIITERLPDRQPSSHDDLATRVRLIVDYLRYLDPAYRAAPGLVKRAVERTPRIGLRLGESRWWRSRPGQLVLRQALRALEHGIPRSSDIDAYLRGEKPDLVLFTPLLALGSTEMDYLDAAVDLGYPTVFCVWSWDNLSSKALLRTMPDRVLVWNETQKREAVTLHRVPARRVVVTGAQAFDQWFEWTVTRSREDFCARVGLPADRPSLLWVCSALLHGSPPEAPFVRHWIEQVRRAPDQRLREAGILIRPHPSRLREWSGVDLTGLGPVSIWGSNPVDVESRSDYFESLTYASAVAGLNTSAFLEAAIAGRPVYTLLLPEHFENQEGTLHFAYLMESAGGPLHASRTWDAHLADLSGALANPAGASARSVRFVDTFIRPAGRDVAATDRFVEAVLSAATPPHRRRRSLTAPIARRVAEDLVRRMETPAFRDWWLSPREYDKVERIRRKRADKDRERERARAALAESAERPADTR